MILSLPQSKETIHIFNKDKLLKMKKDAVLINVGRGSAISNKDLIEVLNQGHLYGVGLDVVEEEPLPATSPLWSYDRVLITPHSSGGFVVMFVIIIQSLLLSIEHLKNYETLENEVDFQTGYQLSHIKIAPPTSSNFLINFKNIMPIKIIFTTYVSYAS